VLGDSRKFQTCSVSSGSTDESLLDVAQNPFHRPARALGRRRVFAVQNRPFGAQALRPNSSAMSSNCPNLGRSSAARMCAESPAFGLDQINPRRVFQNWLLLVLTAPTYSCPASPAMLLSKTGPN